MYAVTNYEGIRTIEIQIQEKHIVVMLLVKPSDNISDEIIKKFNYIHHNSKKYCSIYAVGYSAFGFPEEYQDVQIVDGINNEKWYYSDKCFVEFIDSIEDRIQWTYCGEPEIMIIQSDPDSKGYLTFQNYVSIDIEYGIKHEYIESFARLMTEIVRASKKEITSESVLRNVQNKKYSIKNIVTGAIDCCKKIPVPISRFIKDRLFYRSCNGKKYINNT